MYEFLKEVPDQELLRELRRKVNSAIKIKSKSDPRTEILRILFAIFGYDILYEASIRRLMIFHCSEEDLSVFCDELSIDDENKKFDIANEISTMQWRSGSKLIKLFKKTFKIEKNYLPEKSVGQRRIESVNGKEKLGVLFDYQEEISIKVNQFLASKDVSCLIQMPTGSGKTRTILESIIQFMLQRMESAYPIKIVWLAHSEELLEQSIQTLKKIWRLKGEDELIVGRLWGSYDSIEEIDEIDVLFVGYMKLISLYKKEQKKFIDLKNSFDLIVIDEAHKSASNVLSTLIEDIKFSEDKKIIGLTATPGRSVFDYEENRKLIKLYDGNLIVSEVLGGNPIQLLQERGVLSKLVPIEKEAGLDVMLNAGELSLIRDGCDLPSSILKKLANNNKRNKILLSIIKEEVQSKKIVLVFCCSVEHSKKISVMLASEGVISAAVDFSMRVSARRHVVEDFRDGKIKVLLNYGIFSTGLDVPKLDTVIISRPTSSIVLYSQMIGRGIRGSLVGGTSECRLIDIRDNFINYGNVDAVYKYFESDWSYSSN